VKTWDAIVIGAGIIGLSLAIELNKRGLRVLIVEKGEPGREASWAAGGMLVDCPLETRPEMRALATASAAMYPEFVHELQDESRLKVDLRSVGTIVLNRWSAGERAVTKHTLDLPLPLFELEPEIRIQDLDPLFLNERCVDPRDLTTAAIATARHREIDFSSGDHVLAVEIADGKARGVRTNKTRFSSPIVVNCAGAWSSQIGPQTFPTHPVKGQMLCVVLPEKEMVRHVLRTPDVYLIPRSDGRMLIGATQEEAGFDKRVVPDTILKLRQAALDLVPRLIDARILESWAGLRPGTPDGLPILGATSTPGCFVATGHFRDGILLAPVTAKLMADAITGRNMAIGAEFDISKFSASRFAN
jgi:glycine oxidase